LGTVQVGGVWEDVIPTEGADLVERALAAA